MNQDIVIVEDDADILDVLIEALDDAGYCPIAFRDATSALEHTIRRPPALILTDIGMPGMSGEQLVRAVRALCDRRIPILVTSASSKTPLIASLPIQGFVAKPFDLGHLIDVVADCVEAAFPAAARAGAG